MGIRTWEELQDTDITPEDLWIAWKIYGHLRRALLCDEVRFEAEGEHHHVLRSLSIRIDGAIHDMYHRDMPTENLALSAIGLAFDDVLQILDGEFTKYEGKWEKFDDTNE